MDTRPPIGGVFNAGNYDVRVPADISSIDGASCGLPTNSNAAARLEPPRQIATGLWTFNGCMLTSGAVLYDVTVSISFPGGEHVVVPVIKETNPVGVTRFKIEVNRAVVGGASPTFYANRAARR